MSSQCLTLTPIHLAQAVTADLWNKKPHRFPNAAFVRALPEALLALPASHVGMSQKGYAHCSLIQHSAMPTRLQTGTSRSVITHPLGIPRVWRPSDRKQVVPAT